MCCAQCTSCGLGIGRQVVKQYRARVRVGDVYRQLFFVRTQLKRNHCIVIADTCYYYFILCVWCGGLVNDDDDDDVITFESKISNARPRLKHRFPPYDILYYTQK